MSPRRCPGRWFAHMPLAVIEEHLAAGGVLAIPSESSYGLAVDARSRDGVEAIYRMKERERGHPLPLVFSQAEHLPPLGVDTGDPALAALGAVWPAALTLIVATHLALPAAAGGQTLAVRIPAHGGLRQLLDGLGCALTATSANRSGDPPILDPDRLESTFAKAPLLIVDHGILPGGAPSTLVRATDRGWHVLRAGRFPVDHLPPCPTPVVHPEILVRPEIRREESP